MRFGIRFGPFWVSTSTRRRSRKSGSTAYRCASGHAHRTVQARQQRAAAREALVREAAARAEAAKVEASRSAWQEVARQMGPCCRSCGAEHRSSLEYVSGDPAYTGLVHSKLVVRCRSSGTETRL